MTRRLLIVDLTWSWVFSRSMGAVTVRDTASASPAARTNVLHAPKPDTSSGNSMGIARLSPTSKTYRHTKWGICHPLLIVLLFILEVTAQVNHIFTPLLCWSVWTFNVRVMLPDDFTRLCFHDDTSSPMFSTGLRMIWCKNSDQSIVIELSLSILPLTNTTENQE